MKGKISVALCMSLKEEARRIALKLTTLEDYEVTVYSCDSFNEFIDCISTKHVDSFVFDYLCDKFNVIEIAEKLRNTQKFCRATFAFVTHEKHKDRPYHHPKVKVDTVITRPFSRKQFSESLTSAWDKQINGILPKNLSVLILDNNPNVLEILGMHMEQLSHKNFVTCSTVGEAKELMENQDFDLLLLDWDLEDGTCFEIIDYARDTKRSKRLKESIPIVITGRSDVEDIMTLLQKDIKDHIIKPFDYSEFEDKIAYALERRRSGKP
nr:response regulator [Bacteriovorax sp. HI3]